MPKVQNAVPPPAPKLLSAKPPKAAKTNCGIADFKRSLSEARRKDDAAPVEPTKPQQPAKAKKKRAEADTVDAPVAEEMAEAVDVTDKPLTEEVEGEAVAESPEPQDAKPAATTEPAPAAQPVVAMSVAPPPIADVEDEPLSDVGDAEDEQPDAPVGARPIPQTPAKAPLEGAAEAVSSIVMDEDVLLEEEAAAVSAVKTPAKPQAIQAATAPVADGNPDAKPKAVPAALESLERTIATVDSSPTDPVSAAAADVPHPAAQTTSSTPIPTMSVPGSEHAAARFDPPQPAPQAPVTAQSFAELNHPKIVTSVRAELLPTGGTMQIRLDPPELGALQVLVHMRDGAMTATFQTSNEDATKLLSHSLGQLKQVLESQGVSVDKLHVQQSPRDQPASNSDDHRQQHQGNREDETARHEQQRKEMLRRMWRRLSVGQDPLDLVA